MIWPYTYAFQVTLLGNVGVDLLQQKTPLLLRKQE